MMSTGDNTEPVNPGVPAAHAHSFGPRGSLVSPRAVSLPAKVTRWRAAPRPGGMVPPAASASPTPALARQQPKLLDRLREALRSRHYSRGTEQAYCHWVKRFIFFHNVQHPADMAELEINAFLTHLAVKEKVSASTQNQALSALLFLYRYVLDREIGNLGDVIRARKPKRLPVVMTREEARAVLSHLEGDRRLMAMLMYGAGLPSWNAFAYGSRISISNAMSLQFETAKGVKIDERCSPNRSSSRSWTIYEKSGEFTRAIWLTAGVVFKCPTPWTENTPMPPPNGVGNGCFLRRIAGRTPAIAAPDGPPR